MIDQNIPLMQRMRLSPRIGLMVAGVLFVLIEAMDALAMLTFPDEAVTHRALLAWPAVHAKALQLSRESDLSFWMIRANTLLIAAVAGLFAARFARRLSGAMAELRAAAGRVARGELATPVGVEGPREVTELGSSIDRLRLALGDVMRLARENAGLRKDVALAQAATNLLAPKATGALGSGERMLGFHAATGGRAGFWWHGETEGGRRQIVLGCVEGTGPGAVMSLAALAGAVRDELLHVQDVTPRDLVRRVHGLVSELTPRAVGLCIVTIDPRQGEAHWASAGVGDVEFVFEDKCLVRSSDGDVRMGVVSFADKLAVMMGQEKTPTQKLEALQHALERTAEPDDAWPDFESLLRPDDMPAAIVLMRREQHAKRYAA